MSTPTDTSVLDWEALVVEEATEEEVAAAQAVLARLSRRRSRTIPAKEMRRLVRTLRPWAHPPKGS